MDQVDLLVDILLDKNEEVGARDDAAIYFGQYDDDRALVALIKICIDKNAEEFIFANCGLSLANIWVRKNNFDPKVYNAMVSAARCEAYDYIKSKKPEWAIKYGLKP